MPNISYMESPICTPRLLLSSAHNVTISQYKLVFSNSQLLCYTDLPLISKTNTVQCIQAYITKPERASWFIFLPNLDTTIGMISAQLIHKHKTAILSFVLLPQYEGNGYMHEAISSIQEVLRKTYGICRIEAQVYVQNTKSIAVLQKLNFECEGRLRKNFMIKGVLEDSYMYSNVDF